MTLRMDWVSFWLCQVHWPTFSVGQPQDLMLVREDGINMYIVHLCIFCNDLLQSAARTLFARMCPGMSACPVCARTCERPCAHTVRAHVLVCLASNVSRFGILYNGF